MPDQPEVRTRLLEAAARLLGEEGPAALSTRRLATEAETSTMAVYTHFGGMPALVREIVVEGFARLFARVEAVEPSGDPLEDLRLFAVAYRDNALDNPYLYAVMFGSASLGGYRLHDDDLEIGLRAFGQLVEASKRALEAGALRECDPTALAGQLWVALHGYVLAEHSGYHQVVDDPENEVLWPMLANILFAYLPDAGKDAT